MILITRTSFSEPGLNSKMYAFNSQIINRVLVVFFSCVSILVPSAISDSAASNSKNIASGGYDALLGNTLDSPNLGFKNQIFEPWINYKPDNSSESVIGAAYVSYDCQQDFSSVIVKNFDEYSQYEGKSYYFSPGSELDAMGGPSIMQVRAEIASSSDKNSKANNIQKFFEEHNGEIVISSVSCVTHILRLSSYIDPTFTQAFKEGATKLNAAVRNRSPQRDAMNDALRKFFDNFGTHYFKTAYLGRKTIFQKKFQEKSSDSSEENQRRQCVSNAAAKSIGSNVNAAKFRVESRKCNSGNGGDKFQSESVTTLGNLAESVPVYFELEKISVLFNSGNTKQMFDNGVKKYCSIMFGKDCDSDKGCGFNSKCSSDEKCINDSDHFLGHRCLPDYGEYLGNTKA